MNNERGERFIAASVQYLMKRRLDLILEFRFYNCTLTNFYDRVIKIKNVNNYNDIYTIMKLIPRKNQYATHGLGKTINMGV